MALWRKYFNGTTINGRNLDLPQFPPGWWEKELKQTVPKRIPRFGLQESMTEGSINQNRMKGQYAGTQCTSIGLEAIHWWTTKGNQGYFDNKGLDYVVRMGHYLHITLREHLRVSSHPDNRVGIEDLPDKMRLVYGTYYKQASWQAYVCMGSEPEIEGMDTLTNYLTGFADKPFGSLVTIGDYTQAVFYNQQGKWLVFDSHGCLDFDGCITANASCWEFPTVAEAVSFLIQIRGNKGYCYCLVTTPVIVPDVQPSSPIGVVIQSEKKCAIPAPWSSCRPSTSSIKTKEPQFDDDPFVGLMGGFGGY